MSKVQILRSLVKQRLTAAADEICALFERTIAEYEEELCRSTERNQRDRNLLDSAFTPQLRLHRADVQQLLFSQKKVSPEQQEWSSSLDQQDPEPPHIKDEQEELWTHQEEADITDFTSTLVPVKNEEDDDEKPQFLQLHQRQIEQMETEADGQDCGGPEPVRNSVPYRHLQPQTEDRIEDSPEPETEYSSEPETEYSSEPQAEDSPEPQAEDSPEPQAEDSSEPETEYSSEPQAEDSPEPEIEDSPETQAKDSPEPQAKDSPEPEDKDNDDVWSETKELQSSLNSQKNIEVPVSGVGCGTGKKQFTSSDCGERSSKNSKPRICKRVHTGEKPFSCGECGKRFSQQQDLITHTKIHTGEKPFSCRECDKRFVRKHNLIRHMRIHTGEKPFSCGECGKRFSQQHHLITHSKIHSREKPCSCRECGKRFIGKHNLNRHTRIHTGEKL